MKKTVYVASSFLNKVEARKAVKKLQRAGFEVTSRWLAHRPTHNTRVLQTEAVKDFLDVERAKDGVVVLWPGRLGTASEMGIGIALKRPIFVIGCPAAERVIRNVYLFHPLVAHFDTLDEYIAWEGRDAENSAA